MRIYTACIDDIEEYSNLLFKLTLGNFILIKRLINKCNAFNRFTSYLLTSLIYQSFDLYNYNIIANYHF